MKKIKLSVEEKAISEAIERDEFVPVAGKQCEDVVGAIAVRKKDIGRYGKGSDWMA